MRFDFERKLWLIKRRLVPPEEAAGIEITRTNARLLLLDSQTMRVITAAEVAIPAGTISEGRVVSLANLEAALRNLKALAGPSFMHHPTAVLSLTPAIFFTHVLSLPDIPEENFEEAARLNATQISPIKMQDAYFDWQNLGVNTIAMERELLIALAPRDAINPYLEAGRRAGIDIVAVEPWSLGLIRTFMQFANALDRRAPFLINHISSDGVDFVITKEGKQFFSHFFFWKDEPEAQGGKLTIEAFRSIARRGIAKVSSFFATRHQNSLAGVALFTPFFYSELAAVLKDEFEMKITESALPVFREAPLPKSWAVVLGAGLRGVIPRGEDTIVSLMPTGTEELFRKKQITIYAEFWGKVFAVVLLFFTLALGMLFGFSYNFRQNLAETLSVKRRSESAIAVEGLVNRAEEFNQLVSSARQAEARERIFTSELQAVIESVQQDISIQKLSIFGDAKEMRLTAIAPDRAQAAAFRSRLEQTEKFQNIDLPLGLIRTVPEGIEFTITATIP